MCSNYEFEAPNLQLRKRCMLVIDQERSYVFTKHFNGSAGERNANRDTDMDWSVCGME